ncbi:MAG: DUF4435 domain-containing protein [Bacteroidaceae bacterium]|nr:DUF4435 domain-containing protein [Bacteroidaceae bacterium]
MKHLTENITSRYIEAANRLRPNRARRRVVVYVESYDDIFFWRSVLDEFESETLTFDVMLPSRTHLGKGKKIVLHNSLGPYLIGCVDADYDYLMQGTTAASREMLENPYVFHTYVYSIENYQCHARGLHEVCVMTTLNDREVVDLEMFLTEYSRIVWPLFVWSVWVYQYNQYSRFTLMDFAGIVSIRDINPYHPERTLETLRRTVNRKINWMQQHYPEGKKTYKPLRDKLLSLGLTPETTYLYMQGHALFDGVVTPLLTPVCTQLRKERESEIRRNAVHLQQKQNELSGYQRRLLPIEQALRKSTRFRYSDIYQRLREDLRNFVESLPKNTPPAGSPN